MNRVTRAPRAAMPALAALLSIAALCLCLAAEARAQWTSGGGNTTTPDKVGVGTAAPTALVHARGNLSSPLAGTVGVTQNSATVTGTGTNFTTDLVVGDSIKIGSEVFTVSAIASATSLTLDSNYLGASGSALTAYRDPNLFAADTGDGVGKFTITRSGRLGIGTATPASPLTIYDTSASPYRGFSIGQYSSDTSSALINLAKSRGTPGTPTVVATGDNLGSILASGYNGTGYNTTAGISFQVNGTVTGTSVPTDVIFRSGAGGAGETMRLTSGGYLGIGTANPTNALVVGADFGAQSAPRSSVVIGNASDSSLLTLGQSSSSRIRLKWVYNATPSAAYAALGSLNGSNSLVLQDSGGNVGVGTVAPAYKLDVAGSVNASGLCLGADCKTAWSQVGGSQWANGAGSSINYGAGNVGVGTPTPIRGFHISGPNASGSSEFVLENTGMPANNRKLNLWGSSAMGTSGRFFLRLLNDAGNATTRDFMSFDNATGNIGIGTNSPGYAVEVMRSQAASTILQVTNPSTSAGTASGLRMFTAGNNALTLSANEGAGSGGYAMINQEANLPMVFMTNNAERLRLTGAGNLGIGTTSPTSRLHVGGQADNVFQVTSTGSAASDTVANFGSGVGNILVIRGHGNVGIGTATPTQKLDVAGSVNASGLCLAGDCKTAWSQVGGGTTSQWANGTSSSINYTAGNVGIGTATPDKLFTVQGSIASPGATMAVFRTTGANHGSGLGLDATGAGNNNLSFLVSGTRKAAVSWDNSRNFLGFLNSVYSETDFAMRLNSDGSLTYHDSTNAAERLRVTAGGNVGIGTAAPSRSLEIAKAVTGNFAGLHIYNAAASPHNNTDSVSLSLGRSGTHVMGQITSSNMQTGTYGDGYLAFSTRQTEVVTERMRIDNQGRVGIGKTNPTEALDVVGNIKATGNISATYQDVAEWVPSTQKLQAGTVVVLDTGKSNHVMASATAYDTKVAGVISEQPGIILGVGGEDKVMVATTGRVRVRVDATRGAIKVGDLLVTSEVEGVAMKSIPVDLGGTQLHRPGTIIGKALEPLEKGVGEILVLLSLQ